MARHAQQGRRMAVVAAGVGHAGHVAEDEGDGADGGGVGGGFLGGGEVEGREDGVGGGEEEGGGVGGGGEEEGCARVG